jgi:hypothetical protein
MSKNETRNTGGERSGIAFTIIKTASDIKKPNSRIEFF